MSTSTKEYGIFERIAGTLDARALVLAVDDDYGRRSEFVRDLYRIYTTQADYTPVIVTTPVQMSDAGLMRLIAEAVGLPLVRTRYRLWCNFEVYCRAQYASGRRVLLIFEDAHLMNSAMLRLLHGLSTITVGNDLAVGMVMVGRDELAVKLQRRRHRALWSRIGARVRLQDSSATCLERDSL
ncbi:MAG: ATP-binding protein [Pyrinomonadaceae bacterium MAG19_C2-C3]|nr:ATP-binding protein [Pyrinomonadaceae bacterium MAG19_C2-C3]